MGCFSKNTKQSGGSTESMNQTTQQQLNPVANDAIFGQGGLFASATNLLNSSPLKAYTGQTYAPQNYAQQSANGATLDFLNSPGAWAGYDAFNRLGSALSSSPVGQINLPAISAQNVTAPQVSASGIDLTKFGNISAPTIQGATVGGSGINYQGAIDKILKGEADNPYLRGMMQNVADVSTQNFQRSVAPGLRSGAIAAGGFGGSRQGIAEGLAASDLNNQIQQANTGLLGNVYESAQNRMGNMASQLAGQDAQARMASAQLQQQAALADAANKLSAQQFNANLGMQGAQFNANLGQQAALANQGAAMQAGLANQSAGLQAAGLNQSGLLSAFNANEAAKQQGLSNLGNAANAYAMASQIPLANYQTMFSVGQNMQQDQQAAMDDAYKRFMEQQMTPWTTAGLFANLVQPFAGLGATNTTNANSNSTYWGRQSQTPGLLDWVTALKPG